MRDIVETGGDVVTRAYDTLVERGYDPAAARAMVEQLVADGFIIGERPDDTVWQFRVSIHELYAGDVKFAPVTLEDRLAPETGIRLSMSEKVWEDLGRGAQLDVFIPVVKP